MLPLIAALTLAQATPTEPPPEPVEVVRPQEVRSLPGQFDTIPMFNSNSPELVQSEGILLSTFPPDGKLNPNAHLNFPFNGRFDIFAHHVYRAVEEGELSTLYLGIILYNPGDVPVTVDILQAASYLSQPDAPFTSLPPLVENPTGDVYAGPGSRAMSDILRGQRQDTFPAQVEVPAGGYQMLLNVPIPISELDPPINGRSTLMRVRSSGTVYAASLALFAPTNADEEEREPTLDEWISVLNTGELAGMRDRVPTPPDQTTGQVIYGRVAGVSEGSIWQAQVVDSPDVSTLTVPAPGEAFSYGISTLIAGRMGTGQVQTAPMLVRYPDTAYQAHGNYASQYSLSLPLYNPSSEPREVTIALETPLKEDILSTEGLRFLDPPAEQVFFRGTVRIRYSDDRGIPRTRYVHLVEQRGQMGEPLVTLTMPGDTRRLVEVDLLYPPDSTPPQMLTVQSFNVED